MVSLQAEGGRHRTYQPKAVAHACHTDRMHHEEVAVAGRAGRTLEDQEVLHNMQVDRNAPPEEAVHHGDNHRIHEAVAVHAEEAVRPDNRDNRAAD